MSRNIFHVSDLHFSAREKVYLDDELLSGIEKVIKQVDDPQALMLITGDITFKGNTTGYTKATKFFKYLIDKKIIEQKNFLLCPGNHDICKETKFTYFDSFSYSLRKDNVFTYSNQNFSTYSQNNLFFLGINSAFKLDHTYGIVDVEEIDECLKQSTLANFDTKIAFVHHHLLNQFEADTSALRNSYNLLVLLDKYKFDYIFHGHQHSNQYLPIGNSQIFSCGVRSFNFRTPGYSNGFNHYIISNDSIDFYEYSYSRDVKNNGRIGNFQNTNNLINKKKSNKNYK